MSFKEVYCIKDFVEDGTVYWYAGSYYKVNGSDEQLGAFYIEHEYGEGIIYYEDFDEYFEMMQD